MIYSFIYWTSGMSERDFMTLAYTKSPKVSRRTNFQDELEAVVSARASRTKAEPYSFPQHDGDYDDEDDDDGSAFLKRLGSRRHRASAFKFGQSTAKFNDFDLSDDEPKNGAPKKKVSFLKTQKSSSMSERTTSDDHSPSPTAAPLPASGGSSNHTLAHSASLNDEDSSEIRRGSVVDCSSSSSLSHATSDENSQVLRSPLTSTSTPPPVDSQEKRPSAGSEERPDSRSPTARLSEGHTPPPDGAPGRPMPRPKQRSHAAGSLAAGSLAAGSLGAAEEETNADPQSSQSRTSTSGGSLTHSSPVDTGTSVPPEDHISPHGSDEGGLMTSSNPSLPLTHGDSPSQDRLSSGDGKSADRRYSTSFEEFQEDLEQQLNPAKQHHSNTNGNVPDSRPSSSATRSSGRSRSVCSSRVESRYLGSLKLLDSCCASSSPGQPPLEGGDSLRAAVYQDWLRKKQETLKDRQQQQKKEDTLQAEKKKTEESDQKENAVASFKAWKEKKREMLRTRAKEKEATARKRQQAAEDSEQKKRMAEQVFETWKQGRDRLQREKSRKEKEVETKLKQKKLETEKENKMNSKYAISDWKEKKQSVLGEKKAEERRRSQQKEQEEQRQKEERDQLSLEMYGRWLSRKERDLRRQKEERRVRAVLGDSPPPPWSPPNKTIPFRK